MIWSGIVVVINEVDKIIGGKIVDVGLYDFWILVVFIKFVG